MAIGSTQKSQRNPSWPCVSSPDSYRECSSCNGFTSDEFQKRITINIMSTFECNAGRVDAEL